jgi:exodeoxyribonuclease VII small subunit
MAKKEQTPKFEEMLTELEAIISKMEHGGLTLEETMTLYEKGIELEKKLGQRLEESKQRMMLLMHHDGVSIEIPTAENEL